MDTIGNVEKSIALHVEKGGIIIIGGSHENAFDEFGTTFSARIIKRIYECIASKKDLGVLGTCFGYQSLMQGG
ncbi:MAG: hypothetical protein ABL879_19140 [Devosia sp.]